MDRKIASIQTVRSVTPIKGADRIASLKVLNWHCVALKDDFKPGDLVVFVEPDGVLPIQDPYEFLRKTCYINKNGFEGFKIETVRLQGMVSQGICFPLSILPPGTYVEGQDVSSIMGVRKYEPPLDPTLRGIMKGPMPGYIPKTDAIRVQATIDVLERHRGEWFDATEKLDGVSGTFAMHEGEFSVYSKGVDLQPTKTNAYWNMARRLDIENRLGGMDVAIQGELLGPGIRKNRYKLPNTAFRVHGIYSLERNEFFNTADARQIAQDLGLDYVPLISTFELNHTAEQLIEMATGPSAMNPAVMREGMVVRSVVEGSDPELGRLSFKVHSMDYLLKHKE